ncbi:MAG: NAD(P)/FAD-dependent oxidoreductase [Pseudomonadota bacterium]
MNKADFLIIGAGAVGLAIAAALSEKFHPRSVVVLERHHKFGQETSSRNSEVIHAGIYYPRGSLKARLCVEGNRLMYDFCRQWDIPHAQSGKLIVATTDEEAATMHSLFVTGRENGVEDLQMLDTVQVSRLEPNVNALAALYSPLTGIVDSHRLMARLEWLAVRNGTICAYNHEVIRIGCAKSRAAAVCYRDPSGRENSLQCRWVINSAGLSSDFIAALMGIAVDRAGYRLFPCKGEYFKVAGSKARLVSRLIYPPPFKDLQGLGIHVTKSLDGMVKLGPNAFYVDELEYSVDPEHVALFFESVKDYLPFLEIQDLEPDMAGIRPKTQAPNTPVRDFVICHEVERGLEGVINLIGIESPGLTSCLSIARMVRSMIEAYEHS